MHEYICINIQWRTQKFVHICIYFKIFFYKLGQHMRVHQRYSKNENAFVSSSKILPGILSKQTFHILYISIYYCS